MKQNKIILMYHAVIPDDEKGQDFYCIPVSKFRQQIKYLSTVYKTESGTNVVATFDDGDITNYSLVYPILKEFGFLAYFFIIGSKVGTKGYMNWQQIKELMDSGMIIGSHGMSHRILTPLKDEELDSEIEDSKKILEENLKSSIEYFSVPRGFYNKKIIEKAKACGYKAAFTSKLYEKGAFKIGRISVKNDWDLGHFIQLVNKGYSLQDKVVELGKNCSKKILGVKNYDRVRTRILDR